MMEHASRRGERPSKSEQERIVRLLKQNFLAIKFLPKVGGFVDSDLFPGKRRVVAGAF